MHVPAVVSMKIFTNQSQPIVNHSYIFARLSSFEQFNVVVYSSTCNIEAVKPNLKQQTAGRRGLLSA
jgi:hypothetical protein